MADAANNRGRAILLSLIYPMREEDMTDGQREGFESAVLVQSAFMHTGGGREVKSESLGDAKVTYAESSGVTVSGEKISSEAVGILRRSGLLDCWV